MRGYDQVSFVFGLEVTWSLIQQRQQEEEERKAMLEIENIDEISAAIGTKFEKEEEQGDVNEGEDDTSKCSEDEQDNDRDTPESSINISSEAEESLEAIDAEELTEHVENDEGLPDNTDGVVEVRGAKVEAISMELETPEEYVVSTVEDTVQNYRESRVDNKLADTWECPQCTFINKICRKTCEMCKFKGGSSKKRKS